MYLLIPTKGFALLRWLRFQLLTADFVVPIVGPRTDLEQVITSNIGLPQLSAFSIHFDRTTITIQRPKWRVLAGSTLTATIHEDASGLRLQVAVRPRGLWPLPPLLPTLCLLLGAFLLAQVVHPFAAAAVVVPGVSLLALWDFFGNQRAALIQAFRVTLGPFGSGVPIIDTGDRNWPTRNH